MPPLPEDQRHPHLELIRESLTPDRRRQPGFSESRPDRGGRQKFAVELRDRLEALEHETARQTPPPAGLQPHLVFRIPLAPQTPSSQVTRHLEKLDINIVSVESNNVLVAFRNEVNLDEFRRAVAGYERGPRTDRHTGQPLRSSKWDFLEFIEVSEMRLWSREDRIGLRLGDAIGKDAKSIAANQLYLLDVELWHRGTDELARKGMDELRQLVTHNAQEGEKLYDHFLGQTLCLARVAVRGDKLHDLLDLAIVAEVELPPRPAVHPQLARQATSRDFPRPPRPLVDGPAVCIVDSGVVSNHPLLAANIGHAVSILPSSSLSADENGHGTMVGGIAVFGDIRASFESGEFTSPITLYSARVLNADNQFDEYSLIIHQMRRAIETFINAPYSCRVFNLSLGDSRAWQQHNSRQSLWAECLDILAREYNIVLVVSAGNHDLGVTRNTKEAEQILASYPNYLFDPACGLCEPATAAIAITVGGYAAHDASASLGTHTTDLIRTIANAHEPSPTTRIGPGLNGAIKPEFVAAGGNVAFRGYQQLRQVDRDPGLAVMSFSHLPTQSLFAFEIGTSLAAPQVARWAALVLTSLRDSLGSEPDANLVRAVLASAAEIPRPAKDRIRATHGEAEIRQVYGYGEIDADLLESSDRRVTLISQGSLPLDTFAIYEVPSPIQFRSAKGQKRVVVTLAYDPPVRRRRAKYLGVKMDSLLIRGKSLDEVVAAYRHFSTEERDVLHADGGEVSAAFQSPFKCPLAPGPKELATSTLQRSEWTFSREKNDSTETWYLVVRAKREWAPESLSDQRFAVTVTLEANEPELYHLVRQRVRVRQQQRVRTIT